MISLKITGKAGFNMATKTFTEITASAWNNMVKVLCTPFTWDKWLAVSFAAWLTFLNDDFSMLLSLLNNALSLAQENRTPNLTASIVTLSALGFGMIISILLLWVMSRGEFVYLDKLLNKESKIAEAWRKYSSLGTSVFLWIIIFSIILFFLYLIIIGITFALCFNWIFACIKMAEFIQPDRLVWAGLIFFALAVFITAAVTTVILVIFKNLAVPLMYKNNIKAFPAFRISLDLLLKQPGKMLEYLLVLLLLKTIYVAACCSVGILTCCVFYMFTAIPFAGTAILLPFITFFRFFNLEYLAMFGDEYNVLNQFEK